MRVRVYRSFESLPETYWRLDREAPGPGVTCRLAWYRNLVATTADEATSLRLFGLESDDGAACALLVTRRRRMPGLHLYRHRLEGWSNLYTLSFSPLVSTHAGSPATVAQAFAAALIIESPAPGSIRFDCWDPLSPLFEAFVEALRAEGFLIHSYHQFANLYEEVVGDTWESYLGRRSSQLRALLARKSKKLSQVGSHRFEVIEQGPSLDGIIETYGRVYRASWKPPEPYPLFISGLVETAAQAGWLRLGLLYLDEHPIAAQIWLLSAGRATIYKLAHDERHRALSPGSLLTAHMLRLVIEGEGVREVDFGRGGEPYKSLWLGNRRERWGLLAFNRRQPGALMEAARHLGAKRLRTLQHGLVGPPATS